MFYSQAALLHHLNLLPWKHGPQGHWGRKKTGWSFSGNSCLGPGLEVAWIPSHNTVPELNLMDPTYRQVRLGNAKDPKDIYWTLIGSATECKWRPVNSTWKSFIENIMLELGTRSLYQFSIVHDEKTKRINWKNIMNNKRI